VCGTLPEAGEEAPPLRRHRVGVLETEALYSCEVPEPSDNGDFSVSGGL
jgi:hypothetical protein